MDGHSTAWLHIPAELGRHALAAGAQIGCSVPPPWAARSMLKPRLTKAYFVRLASTVMQGVTVGGGGLMLR